MLLAIVRHAKAEKDSPTGKDFDRALTGHGVRQAEHVAGLFAGHSVRPDAIVTSRAVRARATAELIARACALDLDFDDRLLVARPVSGVIELIGQRARGTAAPAFLVLVGHNDQVSDLLAALTRGLGGPGPNDSGQWGEVIEVATGQAVLVDVPRPEAPLGACRVLDSWRLERDLG